MEEERISELVSQHGQESRWVELEHRVQELKLSMALYGRFWVQQVSRAQEVLWLCDDSHVNVDRSMVTAKVRLMSTILVNSQRTVRVVLDKDSICVRVALIFLIDVIVSLFLTLISRIELYLLLFISRKHSHLLLGVKQLIILGCEFG